MDTAGGEWEVRQIELSLVCGVHNGPVRIGNANGLRGETFVDDVSGNGAKVSCAAAVGNSNGIGRKER